jgi:hypothetical protein
VKWPYFVLACTDAVRGTYGNYPITNKMRVSRNAIGLGIVHGAVLVSIAIAWTIDFLRGSSEFIPLHIATAFVAITSLVAVITSLGRFPPPYQPEIRRKWNQRQRID